MGQRLEGGSLIHRPNILSRGGQPNFPVEALAKQGVSVQQITVPKDVSIPTNSGDGKPILLKSGQSVMVIKTQKGIYLRLSDGKIVAIRVPPGNGTATCPARISPGGKSALPNLHAHHLMFRQACHPHVH
ncbi:hypothetical protein C7M84_006255 [Penaeus vannamei]|uniref:Uncharacterized protein n=1 Tax=Penaeus vannamei TaxID=6689 RepID=A0A3R7M7S1_PENVA|nr:hypothetical protein C7M84_006255 [Penaeus vannamei]